MEKLDLKVGDRVRLRDGTIARVVKLDDTKYPIAHDLGEPGNEYWADAFGKSCIGRDGDDIVAKLDDAA